MNMYSLLNKYAATGAFALMLIASASCSDELESPSPMQPSEYISFYADIEQNGLKAETRGSVANVTFIEESWPLETDDAYGGACSRANVVNSLSGTAHIIAYSYNDDQAVAGTKVIDADYTFTGGMLRSETVPQKWSSIRDKKLKVYSYTPISDREVIGIEPTTGVPTVTYTVNDNVADQEDLLLADVTVDNVQDYNRQPLKLTFKHALSAIRFKAGFDCTVKSIVIDGVYNKGTYSLWDKSGHGNWKRLDNENPSKGSYKVEFGEGKSIKKDEYIVTGENTFILMPQTLPAGAKVILTLSDNTVYNIPLEHFVWESGTMITYTIYKSKAPKYLYFDLAAGGVCIEGTKYTGYRFPTNGVGNEIKITDDIKPGEQYYVYQSTPENRAHIWTADEKGELLTFTRPEYNDVIDSNSGKSWKEFITNNSSVEDVIAGWDKASKAAGMEATDNYIHVKGAIGTCTMTIDNIYSTYEENNGHVNHRDSAGIGYNAENSGSNNSLIINMVGDNRLGAICYNNMGDIRDGKRVNVNNNRLILKGNGSLTVADPKGHESNYWNAVIGNDDNRGECMGIQIDGGVIFAGSKIGEDCTAIGGGGNGTGEVTINGGVVTAVVSTAGTAIGGGIGYDDPGGIGYVTINGGTIYAYNHGNKENIPVSAIGGAGSRTNRALDGTTININGGTIYAESKDGTAIGGGGSLKNLGSDVTITITGGDITAITQNILSCAIGGGSSKTLGGSGEGFDGGKATITISGNPVIRTGSIGGGITGSKGSKIGSAKIDVSGGTIQGQFLLAAGSATTPSFTMTGGTINGKLSDGSFKRKEVDGGAVYMEDGTFTLIDGVIENCTGVRGGAVYLAGGEFVMSGGTIRDCLSTSHGGAIFMNESSVDITGGTIQNNLAYGGDGGGVYIIGNDFHMSGNTCLQGNSAINKGEIGGSGGAVYVFSDRKNVTVDLLSGSIIENTSEKKGGGVCVVINSNRTAKVTVGTPGGSNETPLISRNHTLLQGAGLHVQGLNADITIESGKIKDNKVGAYVANNDVSNEGGLVALNGGDVTHNVITFHANYAGADPATTQQNVVTATRSQLIAPDLERRGYIFGGWSTKIDGTGDIYHDKDVINIDSDINLYAKWTPK